MSDYQIIVIGASMGGTRALQSLLGDLREDFPLPVVIVLHRGKDSDEALVSTLQKSTSLPVSEAEDKEPIVSHRVYLAPPDYHLLIDVGRIANPSKKFKSRSDWQSAPPSFALSTDAPAQRARPSIDVLFQSAAETCRSGVIGIILTGSGQDGAEGLAAVKKHGGLTLVQDPATAECALMPEAAIAVTRVDCVLSLAEIGDQLSVMTKDEGRRTNDEQSQHPDGR